MSERAVRDHRSKDWFWLNNDVIDEWGEKVGADALAVYMVLARMANNDSQTCFPSVPTIAKRIKRSQPTVRKALALLDEVGLIDIMHRPKSNKENESNLYTLLPVREKTPPKSHTGDGQPNLGGTQNGVPTPGQPDLGKQDLNSNKTNEQGNRKRLKPHVAKAARMAYAGLDAADQIYIARVAEDEGREIEEVMWQYRDYDVAPLLKSIK